MWEDPIVEEVRQQRKEIEAKCGDDFDQLFKMAKFIQKKYSFQLASLPKPFRPKLFVAESE